MNGFSRRDFLKTSIVAGTLASVGTLPLEATGRTATDKVTLGNSGIKVTRLAFGTGSNNGHVQAALGQREFSRLIHYAYDRGIRFFETAEAYVTPAMLGEALKPFPRDSYVLMNKVTTGPGVDPLRRTSRMRHSRHLITPLTPRRARILLPPDLCSYELIVFSLALCFRPGGEPLSKRDRSHPV